MNTVLKRFAMTAITGAVMATSMPASASNWLMLQGTEPAGAAARAKLWGFLQPQYTFGDDTLLSGGPFSGQRAAFNQIAPDLKTADGFNIQRARFGIRGTGFPLDSKVSYFFLAEAGNNGITAQGGGSIKVTDASITFNHIKGARVRVGQFKTPISEEGLQAIHVFDYIGFTNAANQLLLERFFDGDGSAAAAAGALDDSSANRSNGPVGAFRDIGIQVFDSFRKDDWDTSYAIMLGNGNGISRGDNDNNKDLYLYLSTEKIYAGKGARRQGWKGYVWYIDGKRTLTGTTGGAGTFDRTRWGIGTTFRKGKWSAAAEYIGADGMIFNGTDGGAVPGSVNNLGTAVASFNVATIGKADGWSAQVGYKVTPSIQLDARYDILNRLTDVAANERKFETVTLGAQYFFNKKSRFLINYEFRQAEATDPTAPAAVNAGILSNIDNRLTAQLLVIF